MSGESRQKRVGRVEFKRGKGVAPDPRILVLAKILTQSQLRAEHEQDVHAAALTTSTWLCPEVNPYLFPCSFPLIVMSFRWYASTPHNPDLLPPPPSYPRSGRPFVRRWRSFHRANLRLRNGVLLCVFIIASLFFYTQSSSPRDPPWYRPSSWHGRLPLRPEYPHYVNASETLFVAPTPIYPPIAPGIPALSNSASNPPPSRTPVPDVLTLEQIRDIVASTRGFFSRDYSLGLGWNNVSIRDDRFPPS
jgi:hypothetical protein